MKNKLKKVRNENKITVEQLAKLINVSPAVIHAIEKDNYEPPVSLAIKIAKELHSIVEHIFE